MYYTRQGTIPLHVVGIGVAFAMLGPKVAVLVLVNATRTPGFRCLAYLFARLGYPALLLFCQRVVGKNGQNEDEDQGEYNYGAHFVWSLQ